MALKEYGEYSVNPFRIDKNVMVVMPKIKLSNMQHVEGKRYMVDYEKKIGLSDRERHIRIFWDGWKMIGKLSAAGLVVLEYLGTQIFDGDDEVYLNASYITKELKLNSRTTAYMGIEDLLKMKFIARSYKKDVYYINPFFFFGGSRSKWWKANKDKNVPGLIMPRQMMEEVKNS
jgi:hypothetical protein